MIGAVEEEGDRRKGERAKVFFRRTGKQHTALLSRAVFFYNFYVTVNNLERERESCESVTAVC